MELSQQQIENIENYIAFEGLVELLHWEDTSGYGFKVKLGLDDRAKLDPFDGTMKRRKHRGGQRYHCIFYGDNQDQWQMEAQFCGRGWAESAGAHVALHFPHLSDQAWWRMQTAKDQIEKELHGEQWTVMLLEIGDDEIIIDQTARERAERPVGGPRSKAVAMMLQDLDFCVWLNMKSIYATQPMSYDTFETADALMKKVCGIASKVELDNGNEEAWKIWETQFKAPFIRHLGKRQ